MAGIYYYYLYEDRKSEKKRKQQQLEFHKTLKDFSDSHNDLQLSYDDIYPDSGYDSIDRDGNRGKYMINNDASEYNEDFYDVDYSKTHKVDEESKFGYTENPYLINNSDKDDKTVPVRYNAQAPLSIPHKFGAKPIYFNKNYDTRKRPLKTTSKERHTAHNRPDRPDPRTFFYHNDHQAASGWVGSKYRRRWFD